MFKFTTRTFAALCASSAFLGFAAMASATSILPGQTVGLSGTTEALEPWLAGTVIKDELHPFVIHTSATTTISGYIQDRVVQETGTGTLDFYYRIVSRNAIRGDEMLIARSGFGGTDDAGTPEFTIDTNYRLDGTGQWGPKAATRSTNGAVIVWKGTGVNIGIGSSRSSYFVLAHTNAMAYSNTGELVLDFNGHLSNVIPMAAPIQ